MSGSSMPGPRVPFVDENGLISAPWYRWFAAKERDASAAVAGEVTAGDGLSGGGVVSDGVTIEIATGGVENAMLRDSLAFSVIGRFQATDGQPADIVASADNRILARIGGVLAFHSLAVVPAVVADGDYGDITISGVGTVYTIDAATVTLAKMANLATDRIIGRDTAGSGVPESLTVGGGIEFTGSGGIQTTALTGDATKTAGGTALTIAANAVSYAKFVAATQKALVGATAAGNFGEITLGAGVAITAGVLSATGTGGTVTTVSVVTANGVSGSVADATTTPAITLTLGAITPSSVASTGAISAGGNVELFGGAIRELGFAPTVGGAPEFVISCTFGVQTNVNADEIHFERLSGASDHFIMSLAGNTSSRSLTVNPVGSATVAQIIIGGITRRWIDFGTTGSAAPAFTTRSVGAKIVLNSAVDASHADYAIGKETSALWLGVPTTAEAFKFYGGTTLWATLDTNGLTLTAPLAVASGGLGVATITGLMQGNGTSAVTGISNSSTVGQVLRVTGASTYAWGALDLADTDAVTGTLPVVSGGTGTTTSTGTVNVVLSASPTLTGTVITANITGTGLLTFTQGTAGVAAAILEGVSGAGVTVDFIGGGDNYYDAATHIFRNIAGTQQATLTLTALTVTGTVAGTNITAGGNTIGNSATATKWATGRTITTTGDATGVSAAFDGSAALSFALTIPAATVTLAKMADIATDRLIGRDTAATGVPEALTVGGGVEFTGSGGIQTSAFTGDATKAAGGTALTFATVNGNVGTFGSATKASIVTANAKGLITAISEATVTPAASSVTGGAALTKVDDTNVTATLGGTPTTALLVAASITLGWTGTLSVARGGTGDSGTAWTDYTPTLAAGSGSFTSAAAVGRSKTLGKTVFIWIMVTITTNGTAGSFFTVTLPTTTRNVSANAAQAFAVREVAATGIAGTASVPNNSNTMSVSKVDAAYLGADGYVVIISGSYETA